MFVVIFFGAGFDRVLIMELHIVIQMQCYWALFFKSDAKELVPPPPKVSRCEVDLGVDR